jgi:hypothetical protein
MRHVLDFRAIAKFLGVFGAGVVTAGFFLSAPIERPAVLQRAPDFTQQSTDAPELASSAAALRLPNWVLVPPAMPYAQPLTTPALAASPAPLVQQQQQQQQSGAAEQQERPTPMAAPEQPENATTGLAVAAQAPPSLRDENARAAASGAAESPCNYAVCRRYYRSFDEATCTYQPYGRGPRELCTR